MLLSGFATPIENMPEWLQLATDYIPLKYYLILIKGVFLKDISIVSATYEIVPMLLLGLLSFGIAILFFKRRTL